MPASADCKACSRLKAILPALTVVAVQLERALMIMTTTVANTIVWTIIMPACRPSGLFSIFLFLNFCCIFLLFINYPSNFLWKLGWKRSSARGNGLGRCLAQWLFLLNEYLGCREGKTMAPWFRRNFCRNIQKEWS